MTKEELHLAAISSFPKFGSRSLLKIKRNFDNLETAWNASVKEFLAIGLKETVALEFMEWRKKFSLTKFQENLNKENISIVTIDAPNYPNLLKEIYDPPAALFLKGVLGSDNFPLAVVGSRRLSGYGQMAIDTIVNDLCLAGAAIVSGLALGADAASHATALKCGGRTIAVLGSGINRNNIYPPYNRKLAEQIIDNNGAIISEFPPGALPLKQHFPIRNRIISGMTRGTLIIEATEDSGSLITAKSALDQNREVFAIPGSIFSSLSAGTNNLLKIGARVVTEAADILDVFNIESPKINLENISEQSANPKEKAILECLKEEPTQIDLIAKITGLPTSEILAALTIMEMRGAIKNLGGMVYAKKRR